MNTYTDIILKHLKALLSIDSPTGYTREVTDYLIKEYQALGYQPQKLSLIHISEPTRH